MYVQIKYQDRSGEAWSIKDINWEEIGNTNQFTPVSSKEPEYFKDYIDDGAALRVITEIKEPVDSTGKLLNQQPAYDFIINFEVRFQLSYDIYTIQIKRQALVPYGTIVGSYNDNIIFNSIFY